MLASIKKGDTVKCLCCGNPIKLTDETFGITPMYEYIKCLDCDKAYDVQAYHMYGENIEIANKE